MTFTSLSRLEASGRRAAFDVGFVTPFEQQVFAVPVYNQFVLQRWQEQQLTLLDQRRLTAIDPGARQAQS